MKIAIYSGAIPSTTFIENLIKGVSQHHKVYLFGACRLKTTYSKNVKKVIAHDSKIKAILSTSFRLFLLLIKHPKRIKIVLEELKKFDTRNAKFRHLSKIIGVLLHKPDIFHVQWAKDLERWMFLKEKFGVKIVLSLRGAHINYSPIADKTLATSYKVNFPNIDAFHAVSRAISKEAQKYNAVKEKIKVIYSILDRHSLTDYEHQTQNNKTIQILSIGRFHWKKGYRYAIDAIKLLVQNGFSIQYTIVASGNISEEILFQINQLDLEDDIIIINGLPQEKVFDLMNKSDCLLLPSLEEGIANVVLEAMTIGLPVISTNCGGMPEVVKHKETGWLVPVRNAKAIKDAILDFNNSSDNELNTIINKAKAIIKTDFDPEINLKKMLDLYEIVANN